MHILREVWIYLIMFHKGNSDGMFPDMHEYVVGEIEYVNCKVMNFPEGVTCKGQVW